MTRSLPLFLVALLATAATALAGSVTTDADGVPHVLNDAPAEGVQRLELVERWRAGGEDDEMFFGVITGADKDPEGNVYLLDTQLSQITVHAPDGTYLRTLGREGEGPGEFSMPNTMVVFDDGRVGVVSGYPGKIVTLDSVGNPGPSIVPGEVAEGGFSNLMDVHAAGEHLLVSRLRMTPSQEEGSSTMNEETYLATLDADGGEITRFWTKTSERDFGKPSFHEKQEYFARGAFDVDAQGRVYVARERERYAVHVYDADGTPLRVIERPDYEARLRTAAEREDVTNGMVIIANGRRLEIENTVEDREPAIERLFVDDEGLLWVADSHAERHDGVFRRFDVFGPEGDWLRSVDVIAPGHPDEDGLMPLGDGRFVLVKGLEAASESMGMRFGDDEEAEEDDGGDADPLEVICFDSP